MQKIVITILGTAGTKRNRETNLFEINEEVEYKWINGKTIKKLSTFPLLIEKFKDYKIIPLYTKTAKNCQELILEHYNIDFDFNTGLLIENENNIKEIFHLINSLLRTNEYEEIIVDITHGFRHLPLLMLISLINFHLENPHKIKKILFAQEQQRNAKYEFMDLKEYLDLGSIALLIRTFLSTFKLPPFEKQIPLYENLRKLSIHLTSNQFPEIFEKDLPALKQDLEKKEKELFFIEGLIAKLKNFIYELEKIKDRPNYQKFLYLSQLFLEKEYYLQSATYLIETIPLYIETVFRGKGYLEKNADLKKMLDNINNLLRIEYKKDFFKFPNLYFLEINSEIFKELNAIREKIGEIRHNLVHINRNMKHENIEKDLKLQLNKLTKFIKNKKLETLDETENNKKYTLRFIKEKYQSELNSLKKIKSYSNVKLETFIKKGMANKIPELTQLHQEKAQEFYLKNKEKLETIFEFEKNKKYLLSEKELAKLK